MYFVICPTHGPKIKDVVLNRVGILCPKQGQTGFQTLSGSPMAKDGLCAPGWGLIVGSISFSPVSFEHLDMVSSVRHIDFAKFQASLGMESSNSIIDLWSQMACDEIEK